MSKAAPKKKSVSPTQRSLKLLRERGFTVQVVERWNQFAKVRQDLFGFIDLVAIHPLHGIQGIQTTTGDNMSKRINKIAATSKAQEWLMAGGKIVVHGWRQIGKAKKWECRVERIKLPT